MAGAVFIHNTARHIHFLLLDEGLAVAVDEDETGDFVLRQAVSAFPMDEIVDTPGPLTCS